MLGAAGANAASCATSYECRLQCFSSAAAAAAVFSAAGFGAAGFGAAGFGAAGFGAADFGAAGFGASAASAALGAVAAFGAAACGTGRRGERRGAERWKEMARGSSGEGDWSGCGDGRKRGGEGRRGVEAKGGGWWGGLRGARAGCAHHRRTGHLAHLARWGG